MRRYETVFISDPDLSGDDQAQLFEKVTTLISSKGGVLVDFDEWGSRRLAYEIMKKQRGYYVRLDYCGDGTVVRELENAFRLDDRVLKFMTIFLQDKADPEELKRELADKKAESGDKEEDAGEAADSSSPEAEKGVETSADNTENEAEESGNAVEGEKDSDEAPGKGDAASAENA